MDEEQTTKIVLKANFKMIEIRHLHRLNLNHLFDFFFNFFFISKVKIIVKTVIQKQYISKNIFFIQKTAKFLSKQKKNSKEITRNNKIKY